MIAVLSILMLASIVVIAISIARLKVLCKMEVDRLASR